MHSQSTASPLGAGLTSNNERGNVYLNQQNYVEIADYSKAIELNSQNAGEYFRRANTYLNQKKYKQAIVDCNKAIELNSKHAGAYFYRGKAYFQLGNNEQSIADFNKVLSLNPQFAAAYFRRGVVYFQLGNNEQSIADCSKTIELNPKNAEAYFNRGKAYIGRKKYSQAIADFSKAVQLVGSKNGSALRLRSLLSKTLSLSNSEFRSDLKAKLKTVINALPLSLEQKSELWETVDSQIQTNSATTSSIVTTKKRGREEGNTEEPTAKRSKIVLTTPSISEFNQGEFQSVVRILRGTSSAAENCTHLAAGFFNYLLTGKKSEKAADSRPSTLQDFWIDPQYSVIKRETGAFASISNSRIVHANDAYPAFVQLEIPQTPGGAFESDAPKRFRLDDFIQHSCSYSNINHALQEQAKSSEFQVSFGFINLGRAIKLDYSLVAMSNQEKPNPQQIEVACSPEGMQYRLLKKGNAVAEGELPWTCFDDEDIPGSTQSLLQKQFFLLPSILRALKKSKSIPNNVKIPEGVVGHQLIYFATPTQVWFVDCQGYQHDEKDDVNEYIFSDLKEKYCFLGTASFSSSSSSSKELWGNDVFFAPFFPQAPALDAVYIKPDPDETSRSSSSVSTSSSAFFHPNSESHTSTTSQKFNFSNKQ